MQTVAAWNLQTRLCRNLHGQTYSKLCGWALAKLWMRSIARGSLTPYLTYGSSQVDRSFDCQLQKRHSLGFNPILRHNKGLQIQTNLFAKKKTFPDFSVEEAASWIFAKREEILCGFCNNLSLLCELFAGPDVNFSAYLKRFHKDRSSRKQT